MLVKVRVKACSTSFMKPDSFTALSVTTMARFEPNLPISKGMLLRALWPATIFVGQ